MPRDRDRWTREIAALDPHVDHRRIYALHYAAEFPWDLEQALGLALYRTYAVPSIGALLDRTGEFERAVQKRYDDTGLLLHEILFHGTGSAEGRAAVRRINRMHRRYDIGVDDLRYVLCTFVTVPLRWLDRFGWRPLLEVERVATAEYYRDLGRHLGIPDLPRTWREFGEVMDAYEAAHFAFHPGGRRVADATLGLMATFPPHHLLPATVSRRAALALLDAPLLDAFGYPHPPAWQRRAMEAGLRARAAFLRRRPPRATPRWFTASPTLRSYPHGWDVDELGTFPAPGGCPVVHVATAYGVDL